MVITDQYIVIPPHPIQGGYANSSVMPLVNRFKPRRYFIYHGLTDDNVHFQNAAELYLRLVEAKKPSSSLIPHLSSLIHPESGIPYPESVIPKTLYIPNPLYP